MTLLRKICISLLLLICLASTTYAMNPAIDSLQALYAQAENEEEKIELQCEISQRYTEIGEFEKGNVLANQALNKATEIGYTKGIALSYYSLSRLKQYMGDWNKALIYHYRALPLFDEVGAYEELAWAYLNMGICFYSQENFKKAFRYEKKALDTFIKVKHRQGEAYSYLNMSLAVNGEGYYDSALVYMDKSKAICEEINDMRGVGYVLSSMADIHLKLKEYDRAIADNLACIEIRKKENDKMDMSYCYSNLGLIYFLKGNIPEATSNLQTGERLALDIKARPVLRDIYSTWSKVDSAKGDYRSAYHYYKRYAQYQDLLSSEENERKADALQHQFEKDRQNRELEQLKKEKKLDNQIAAESKKNLQWGLMFLGAGLAMLIVFAIFMIKRASILRKQRNIIGSQKEKVDQQNKAITDSIVYARKIQQALLTSEEYIQSHLKKEFFIYYQPKDIVSGDFYWAHQHKDAFYLATADCTGHGVPGAFMSLLNISIMNEVIVERDIQSPAKVLDEQKNQIVKALSTKGTENSNDGMDCVLCKFDLKSSTMTFAGANNGLWIVRNKEVIRYKGDKMPVGNYVSDAGNFTEQNIELQAGDMIYTFTDGVVDQFGGKLDKKFKPKRFEQLLLDIHQLPVDEQNLILMRTIEEWMGDNEQTDDILVIGIRY